jgi:hypothetical protein
MLLPYLEDAELVKLVPAQNQARFYRLAIWPDLFGGVSLVREYGRLGHSGGRLRIEPVSRSRCGQPGLPAPPEAQDAPGICVSSARRCTTSARA